MASFVHPGRAPQMADAEAVIAALPRTPGAIRRIAPQTVGQDNAQVLGDLLGLEAADLEGLKERGVI